MGCIVDTTFNEAYELKNQISKNVFYAIKRSNKKEVVIKFDVSNTLSNLHSKCYKISKKYFVAQLAYYPYTLANVIEFMPYKLCDVLYKLTKKEISKIISQILRCIEILHGADIVHGHLTINEIFVTDLVHCDIKMLPPTGIKTKKNDDIYAIGLLTHNLFEKFPFIDPCSQDFIRAATNKELSTKELLTHPFITGSGQYPILKTNTKTKIKIKIKIKPNYNNKKLDSIIEK